MRTLREDELLSDQLPQGPPPRHVLRQLISNLKSMEDDTERVQADIRKIRHMGETGLMPESEASSAAGAAQDDDDSPVPTRSTSASSKDSTGEVKSAQSSKNLLTGSSAADTRALASIGSFGMASAARGRNKLKAGRGRRKRKAASKSGKADDAETND